MRPLRLRADNLMDDSAFSPLEIIGSAEQSHLFGPGTPCPVLVEPGSLERVWVISGENAGGKSLFCRAVQVLAARAAKEAGGSLEVMRVGMDMRTTSGIQRALMFGDENRDSTGKISVSCLLSGLRTAEGRENPHWLVLDEPDVGVGEGYRRAIGEMFSEFARNLPANTFGFIVVTHAREIAEPMVSAGASSVRVGDDLRPVAEWIRNGDLPKTVEDLKNLPTRATLRLRAVAATLSNANAKDEDARSSVLGR